MWRPHGKRDQVNLGVESNAVWGECESLNRCLVLGAGAWGCPREMLWVGRWEGGSCLGTHVRIKDFKI